MNILSIKGGKVVDTYSNKIIQKDLFIKNGIFVGEKNLTAEFNNATTIDAADKYIIPGLTDLRCHLEQPGLSFQKSVQSISRQGLAGGYTSLLAMPALSSFADNPETLRYFKDSICKDDMLDIHLSGCLTMGTKGDTLAPIGSLKEMGIVAVTDCPNSPQNNQIYLKAVEYASMFDLPILDLPRDYSLSPDASAHESLLSYKLGLKGSPRISEELFVQRSILASKYTNAKIHLTSVSSFGSVELIEKAKRDGIKITSDTTSNHLTYTEDLIEKYDSMAKAYPPFREESDRLRLNEAVQRDTIDSISSGHQQCGFNEKRVEFDLAPCGVLGLEQSFVQLIKNSGDSEKLENSLIKITKKMSEKPREILNLNELKVSEGKTADFFIYDPKAKTKIERDEESTVGQNYPQNSQEISGAVIKTFVKGRCLYDKE